MGLTQWWRRLTGKKDVQSTKKGRGSGISALPAHLRTLEQPTGKPGQMPTPDPAKGVLGVDPTKSGWLGALLDPTGHGTPHLLVAASLEELLAQAGEVAVVAITVPMGLPDQGRREADVATRAFLGDQGSTVLTTPVRDAVYAISHGEANTLNRDSGASGVSSQAWELRRRIQELDAWLRQDLRALVVQTHPEASFAVMGGAPLTSRRRTGDGATERRSLLAKGGVYVPTSAPHGVGTDAVLDVCAAAWSAHRVKLGQARSFPEEPVRHSDGIPAAIHV